MFRLRLMSFFGRLFGGAPAAAPEPVPANQVPIAEDLLPALTADGTELAVAVDRALRSCLDREAKAAQLRGEKLPFWLRRDDEQNAAGIEDELRDRVLERHAAEDE